MSSLQRELVEQLQTLSEWLSLQHHSAAELRLADLVKVATLLDSIDTLAPLAFRKTRDAFHDALDAVAAHQERDALVARHLGGSGGVAGSRTERSSTSITPLQTAALELAACAAGLAAHCSDPAVREAALRSAVLATELARS